MRIPWIHCTKPHFEYAEAVWSPHNKIYLDELIKVQMRAKKLLKGIKHLSNMERLSRLNLPKLKYRRWSDMEELFKIMHGLYDGYVCVKIRFLHTDATCGNKYIIDDFSSF